MVAETRVRELLLATWGRQACQNPAHWPEVLERLLKDAPATPGGTSHGRASLKPAVEEAVAALAAAFAAGPPPDPADCVWRAFPKLDRAHCAELAELLMAEAAAAAPVPPSLTAQSEPPFVDTEEEKAA
jgi:hypothetical protein